MSGFYQGSNGVVEALQLNAVDINDNLQVDGALFTMEAPEWAQRAAHQGTIRLHQAPGSDYAHLMVGNQPVCPGDWIVNEAAGLVAKSDREFQLQYLPTPCPAIRIDPLDQVEFHLNEIQYAAFESELGQTPAPTAHHVQSTVTPSRH